MTGVLWVLCWTLLGLSAALVCPDGGMCEDRDTCCRNTQGGYGCCPLPHAECCSDHLHCCYQGTVCDLVLNRCVNKTVSLPWVRRVPAKPAPVGPQLSLKAVVCPDQESECPDDTTCCQLLDGSWGCCPLAKAVCCEDKLHCCPEGTTCDLTHSRCVSASLDSVPLLDKLPSRRRDAHPAAPSLSSAAPSAGSLLCPGGRSRCPQRSTCCLLSSGEYACCPYPQATCCSDHIHCCPGDTTCDLEHAVCTSGERRFPLRTKIPAAHGDVVCPDRESVCPDQTTCCQMANGTYGCCPMPSAVCCSDHVHCCPAGTQCDLQHSTCVSGKGIEPVTQSMLALERLERWRLSPGRSVPCNDSVACGDGMTCCQSVAGQWACCPLPEAVCCEDHLHCCPHDTVCNLAASTCDDPSGGAATPWLSKLPAVPLVGDNSKCDKSTSCPGKSTCCRTPSGAWACCPLPEAVCCDDHVHCCPHATVCNLKAQTCDDPSGASPSVRWLEKTPAVSAPPPPPDEKCDRETMCPGGTTCCRQDSGQWACCPLPQAVCCSDHEHCCPSGYRCNVAQQTCDKPDGGRTPWLRKVAALKGAGLPLVGGVRNMCDGRTSCPRDTTCCFMGGAQGWGCCPLPDAVCCADGKHCCPSGHTCDPHHGSCSRGGLRIPWFSKLSPRTGPAAAAAVGDVKCDDKSSCAAGATCCKLPSGEWGCCPLVKAVCCTDHEHCCPQGYTCNMESGTCEKKSFLSLPQTRVVQSEPEAERDVPCDGAGGFRCSRKQTCCRTSETEWGCCPSPGAVCCPGSASCCPAGFQCDPRTGGCSRSAALSWNSLLRRTDRDSTL
ncbi:granulin b [Salarias fasciatus]|uniref:Progranulin-like n=1 Tax=Salarias fasciatus TaxID=181472 RepID=A0A672J4W9_SALFA|nr:progranulin-like [Salarias fasciatus]XP_029953605.1 progranulin-like [Salarias fasciatus]